ncbi:hypothetical protein ACO0SA_001273 [Hanseniaspora valbyensis]
MKLLYFIFATVLATISTCSESTTTLSPSAAAAVADFPLVAAFMEDFTKYSYNDYVAALSSQGTSVPYVLNNYFLAFEELSNYEQVESVMMQTFPFSEFAAVVTKVSWYSELLSDAEMTTFYFPSDFSTGTVITYGADVTSASATEAASVTSAISATSTYSSSLSSSESTTYSSFAISSDSESSAIASVSSSSSALSSSISTSSALSSSASTTKTTTSSSLTTSTSSSVASSSTTKSSNMGSVSLYSIPLFVISFILTL